MVFTTICSVYYVYFFFSSRRRHTRWTGDWSSDVCSSDLAPDREALAVAHGRDRPVVPEGDPVIPRERQPLDEWLRGAAGERRGHERPRLVAGRSEERRVGKECWV